MDKRGNNEMPPKTEMVLRPQFFFHSHSSSLLADFFTNWLFTAFSVFLFGLDQLLSSLWNLDTTDVAWIVQHTWLCKHINMCACKRFCCISQYSLESMEEIPGDRQLYQDSWTAGSQSVSLCKEEQHERHQGTTKKKKSDWTILKKTTWGCPKGSTSCGGPCAHCPALQSSTGVCHRTPELASAPLASFALHSLTASSTWAYVADVKGFETPWGIMQPWWSGGPSWFPSDCT